MMGWRWPVGERSISSLFPYLGRLGVVELFLHWWVGLGVCGGVPSGVPLALCPLARNKYIAPLNLHKRSDEVRSR